MSAIVLRDVVKRYGSQRALDELSFEVPRGAICGLIGPNGSGKTTTMGILGGLIRPQRGQVDLLQSGPFDARKHAGRISLMPQDAVPNPNLRVMELLVYYARLLGMSPMRSREEASRRLAEVELRDRGNFRYGQLSHGMRRRFSIAQALLGNPEVILLDEPTSGLDPQLVVSIRRLLMSYRGRATLLVSSHILSELETLCDHLVFIDAGRCVRQGPLGELTSADRVVRYTLSTEPDLEQLSAEIPDCSLSWNSPVLTLRSPRSRPTEEINRLCLSVLLESRVGILQVQPGEGLEATYLRSRGAERTSSSRQGEQQ